MDGFGTPKRKRTILTIDQKREIVYFYETSSIKITYKQLFKVFFDKWQILIAEQTLCDIIKQKELLMNTSIPWCCSN